MGSAAVAASLALLPPAVNSVVVEDLIQGLNEWRNIQDIVRVTFKAFHDVLKAQGEAIRRLESAMESKVSRTDMATGLQSVSADVKAQMSEVITELSSKASAREVSAQIERRPTRAEVAASLAPCALTADVTAALQSRALAAEVVALSQSCGDLREALGATSARGEERFKDLARRLDSKVEREDFEAGLRRKADTVDVADHLDSLSKACVSRTAKERESAEASVAALRGELGEGPQGPGLAAVRACPSLVDSLQARLQTTQAEVKDIATRAAADGETSRRALQLLGSTFDSALAEARSATAGQMRELRDSTSRLSNELQSLRGGEDTTGGGGCGGAGGGGGGGGSGVWGGGGGARGSSDGGRASLGGGAAPATSARGGGRVASLATLEQLLRLKADASEVRERLADKASQSALELLEGSALTREESERQLVPLQSSLAALQSSLAPLQSSLAPLQSSVAALGAEVSARASVDEVNAALAQVTRELDARVTLVQFQRAIREATAFSASLSGEICVGRWLWQTGRTLKPHSGIPWNHQTINTDPDNLVWEKDRPVLVCMLPGLYQFSFGFFTRKKPQVQLLVNGEPVLSASGAAVGTVVHHSSGRAGGNLSKHPAGNITGLTATDFLALPARARLSVTFQLGGAFTDNPLDVEGFLSLQKL